MAQRVRRKVEAVLGSTARDWMIRFRYSSFFQNFSYRAWIACFEQELRRLSSVENGAHFLMLVRTNGATAADLDKTLRSLQAQSQKSWTLVVLVAGDTVGMAQSYVERASSMEGGDAQVIALGPDGLDIGLLSARSRSEFFVVIEAGDILAPDALTHCSQAINAHSDARLLYSDEDVLTSRGVRIRPCFKPQWSPDFLVSRPYLGGLCVMRCDHFLQQAAHFLVEPAASVGDACAVLNLSELTEHSVIHIPHVLYHRRAEREGWASWHNAPPQVGLNFTWDERHQVCRPHYPVPEPEPLVSILVPTRDRRDLLEPCVRGILERTAYRNFELLILDNQSSDPATLSYLAELPERDMRVTVLRYDHPFNYSAIINFGAAHASGELLLLLNNDVDVIRADWIREMVSHALRPEIGCVGAKLYYDDDTIQHAGVVIGLGGVAGHAHRFFPRDSRGYMDRLVCVQNFSAVTAACLMVRKAVFQSVGGFEVESLKVAFNDVDFCLKVGKLGLRNLWTPYAELYHYESKSRGHDVTPEKRVRFLAEVDYMRRTWGIGHYRDPYYHPFLTRDYEDFSIDLRGGG